MHPKGIDIFNKADGDDVVVRIPDHFQLQLFPAEDRFFHQDLPYKACLKPSCTYRLEFFLIIDKAAACTAHRISRTKHHRIAQLVRNSKGFLNGICHFAAGHFNPQLIHSLFKLDPVFPPFNGIHLHANDLHMILIQNSRLAKLRT